MFQLPNEATIFFIEGEYSIPIVLLSFLIAFGASYTALFINKEIQRNSFFPRNIWLLLASLAMGLGIWSMHFIGMTAFQLPIAIKHNTWLTIISAIPAILASFIAFYLANQKDQRMRTLISASVLMGLGISSMHYLGMAAMELDAEYVYQLIPLILSIFIAIFASFVALLLFSYGTKVTDKVIVKLVAALSMAIAISSMHYIGMGAIKFYSLTEVSGHGNHMHTDDLTAMIAFIAIGISGLFLLTYLTSRLDRYVNFRIKHFDPLTSLPNQNQFMDDQVANPKSSVLAIIHISNLERFITAYGYSFGDDILLQVKELIEKILPEGTKLYRTEANRFTIVAPKDIEHQVIRISLDQICSILSKPLLVEERFITVEMVVALASSEQEENIQDLFSNAIAVLQSVHGDFVYQIIDYNPQQHTYNFERQILVDFQRALEENQLFVVYQPKIHPVYNGVDGFEALIRWEHPEYGVISPAKFIPVLENSNKITELTDWIIEEVCHQMEKWKEVDFPFQRVSINIPGSYITSPNLVGVLNESLMRHHIQAHELELEITETSVIGNIQNAIDAVRSFRKKGFHVALDDFGTGLSSLSYLKEIPITTIKIDKSFIDGILCSRKDAAILKAILNLCESLDLNVVVEGVENEEQVQFLLSADVIPIIQGYYYSKPLEAEDAVKLYGILETV